mmetsp:Transcript_8095/g.16291  ORF Transcript_8095/g.16291 Transcript_8095/m.16291 type:complete len:508 (-) Transcript_8095:205-1728(-)
MAASEGDDNVGLNRDGCVEELKSGLARAVLVVDAAHAETRRAKLRAERVIQAMERPLTELRHQKEVVEAECRRLEAELLDRDGTVGSRVAMLAGANKEVAELRERLVLVSEQLTQSREDLREAREKADRIRVEMQTSERRAGFLATELKELMEWKADKIPELSALSVHGISLLREARESQAATDREKEKVAMLEKEVKELGAACLKATLRGQSLQAELESSNRSWKGTVESLRGQVAELKVLADARADEVAKGERALASFETDLERFKVESTRETQSKDALIKILKESCSEQQSRIQQLESDLVSLRSSPPETVPVITRTDQLSGRPLTQRVVELDRPSRDLLRIIGAELELKISELERKSAECDRVLNNEAKMAVQMQAAARERDNHALAARIAEQRAAAAEQGLTVAERRIAELERRIHLMSEASRASPSAALTDTNGTQVPMTPRTPGLAASPAQRIAAATPSERSLSARLNEIRSSQKRHRDQLASAVAQRALYRGTLSPSPP